MQLSPDDAPTLRLGMKETAERILALRGALEEIRNLEAESVRDHDRGREAEQAAFEREKRELEERVRTENSEARARRHELQGRLQRERESRRERLLRAAGELQRRLEAELGRERESVESELSRIRQELAGQDAKRRKPLEQRVRRWEELLPQLRERFTATEKALREFAGMFGVAPTEGEPWSGEIDLEASPDRMEEEAGRIFEGALVEARHASDRWGNSFARAGYLCLYHLLVLVVGAGAVVLSIRFEAQNSVVATIIAATVVGSWLLRLASRPIRRRYQEHARELLGRARGTIQRFESHADAALKQLDAGHVALAEARADEESKEEVRLGEELSRRTTPLLAGLDELKRRRERAEKRLLARHEARMERLEAEELDARRRREEAHEARVETLLAGHRGRLAALDAEHSERMEALAARREVTLGDFTRFANAARQTVEERNPPWAEIDPRRFRLPESYPRFVPFGRLEVSVEDLIPPPGEGAEPLGRLRLPATLAIPEHGSLLVRHAGGERDLALTLLSDTVLRVLTSFPPGKARLTIIDPVGLGQSFSALMHLADHDESLVDGRIWTETQHIERRLAGLTGHIEKVIQKYLRNRYNSIGEYNAEAGELQEPYHFLVIADFPTGFSDVAAERLSSIVSSGPRCGVYTLIAQDTRPEMPVAVDEKRMGLNGPIVQAERGGLRLVGEAVGRCSFEPEPPPEPGPASALLDSIGRQSVDADRVEVPFAAVTPPEAEMWSGSTRTGVRVPIGRTGAERLQYLDLGRGTAQHALIAGRTGSGKSTLFHVMISNMSLWFSPLEIEFYLIDFKKGVEFKPFATHGLPHARVVAIESDREFGLSVLKAVDAELERRGDLFRHQGVQDLAAYRRSGAEENLPRTLVLIDEFQEFFTEDDVVARDAALLLDRFVRQGRAFGIHIVLGSQTLSGIYTLAKSTLGQMGVRIALQCNESDSYLILSEDNGVARLLSRPGEAIYNDMSGLIEGNNPFQVVWLPENEEAVHLRRIADRASQTPSLPPPETVVFEGNLPADLARSPELTAMVDGDYTSPDGDVRIWLGEPNAIKGSTEIRFYPASGSNLLIVGQRRDSAFAIMTAAVLSLAGQLEPGDVRIVILDGGGHEPEYAGHFENLLGSVPHRIERYDVRTAPDAVAELAAGLKEDAEREEDRPAVFLFAFGLQRLRSLRREDEFSMSFDPDRAESTGEQFATILTEGPPQGVHTVVWCDTVANLSRTLDRRALREFDMRVLFQMSAPDSSELIDSTAANLLGLHNALLALESQGTFEKFRPYAIPDGGVMRRFGRRTVP